MNNNFKDLLEMQEKLDTIIFQKHNVTRKSTSKRRLVSLKVELAELANEIEFFKYWKTKHVVNKNKVLEEAADCLHFILSLTIDYKIIFQKEDKSNLNIIFRKLDTFSVDDEIYTGITNTFLDIFLLKFDYITFPQIVDNFIKICLFEKISKEELINAYIKKNQKNYERIASGY